MNVATVLGVVCNEKKTVGLGESFWKLGVSDFKEILEPTLILIMRSKVGHINSQPMLNF